MNSLVTPDWSTARGYWYWRKHAACVFGSRAPPGISVALTARPIDPDEGNIAAQILVERHVPRMAEVPTMTHCHRGMLSPLILICAVYNFDQNHEWIFYV
jgi:hypothetical protein